jgi:cysteine sulfinate desulfinase/cysteine desulfurase-like protein
MNFVAIIGIVENKDVQTKNNSIITVKVEKPFVENENDE